MFLEIVTPEAVLFSSEVTSALKTICSGVTISKYIIFIVLSIEFEYSVKN